MQARMEAMRQMLDEMDELMAEEMDGGKAALQELSERIDALAAKHTTDEQRTAEARIALAREQLTLESIWLG
jgi:hypothetical protein